MTRHASRPRRPLWQPMHVAASLLTASVGLSPLASAACPATQAQGRPAGAWLTVVHGGSVQHLDAAQLDAIPGSQRTLQRRLVAAPAVNPGAAGGATSPTDAGAPAPVNDTSTTFKGWQLRDVLARVEYALPADRGARLSGVEAVALDGWRAWFSWGEIFNSAAGDQMLVISQVDGVNLDNFAGPLALRALADTRPGPRHVRQLCALIVLRR